MDILIVVQSPQDWDFDIPEVKVISARAYLTEPEYVSSRSKVFNLCRSYQYQRTGYYVSLLAEARGHKPIPNIATIEDMKSQSIIRYASEELEELIHHSLAPLRSNEFTLSIYFGRNPAKRYDRLSAHLFRLFQTPFVRAHFTKEKEEWHIKQVGPISAKYIPEEHRSYVIQFASEYFAGRRAQLRKKVEARYDLAILYNENEDYPPSDEKALKKFVKAAESIGLATEMITKEDFHRIPEFDALFIRETTNVHHYTYQFSRRAAAEGLVVIDDPYSILKCTNKVYLSELLQRHKIKAPASSIIHQGNLEEMSKLLTFPCVLKQPDSAFSRGVIKIDNSSQFLKEAKLFLKGSDLIVAQEFLPTSFDWRVGVLDQQLLYVCKYYMVEKHWQVIKRRSEFDVTPEEGKADTFNFDEVPPQVLKLALKACNLIGKGLYGVDLKQVGNEFYVIEINDNPNIDAGCEDRILKDGLYTQIMEVFLRRIEKKKSGGTNATTVATKTI